MLRYTGMADGVALVSSTLPALVSKPAFQVGILAATTSISGCSSARRRRRRESGIPRYLEGKWDTTHGNASCTSAMALSSQRIGVSREDTLVDISDKARHTSEKLQRLGEAQQVIRRREEDNEVVCVQRHAVRAHMCRQWRQCSQPVSLLDQSVEDLHNQYK